MHGRPPQSGRLSALVVALGLALAGCGGEDGFDAEPTGTLEEAISNGSRVTSNVVPYSSVVQISSLSGFPSATATKIGTNKFLVAGHSVRDWISGSTQIRIRTALSADDASTQTVTLDDVFLHPSISISESSSLGDAYDVGVITIADSTSSIPVRSISATYIEPGRSLTFSAYGLDNDGQGTNNTDFKQLGAVTTASRGSTSPARFARYIKTTGASSENGDSGGPLFENTVQGPIVGIVSGGFELPDTTTHFTRMSNVRIWIAEPHNGNLIQNDRSIFLLNRAFKRCVALNSATTVTTFDCDGRFQPADDQYWKPILRLTSGGTQYFSLKNTKLNSNSCLSVTASGNVAAATCSTNDALQHFSFRTAGRGRIFPRQFATCVTASSTGTLTHSACVENKHEQQWVFHQ